MVSMIKKQSLAAGRKVMAAGKVAAMTLLMLGAVSAHAGGDAKAGEEKAATCAACHGADGVSQIPSNPILAGQYPSYLEQALKSYRSGERENAIMAGFAAQLSDQDIADLAAWFASQDGPLATAQP